MEKRVSIRDIAEMHLSQQLERKKALLLNLELDACARQGIPWTPTQGILSLEDRRRYEMNQSIILPNGTFTKQFSLPNYFRGENAYAPTGKNLQKYDVADKYIPGIRKECAGGPEEWLEFTSNFDLALFYACCKWDEEQLEWLPMTEADIERPFGEGEPDPHYGVIYMANAEDARFFGTYANAPEYHIMTPAGSLVDGGNREYIFAMRMRDKDELQKDARFDILLFEHTEKFCQDVYELMQESLPAGSAVFKKNLRK